jgi:hypothetical protein
MSLASELLHSTSKRRDLQGAQGRGSDPVQRLLALNSVVYGLLSDHEPTGDTEALLRADLRIMHLSGLTSESSDGVVTRVCKQAASVMAELVRLLPRCRE